MNQVTTRAAQSALDTITDFVKAHKSRDEQVEELQRQLEAVRQENHRLQGELAQRDAALSAIRNQLGLQVGGQPQTRTPVVVPRPSAQPQPAPAPQPRRRDRNDMSDIDPATGQKMSTEPAKATKPKKPGRVRRALAEAINPSDPSTSKTQEVSS